MKDLAIRVDNLGKKYKIGQLRSGDLRGAFGSLFRSIISSNPYEGSIINQKHSREFWALRNISFQIRSGEAIGIIGRNGAGKSTLLKILSRITDPTTGIVEITGRVSSLLEVGTGFHPELTGRENIYLNGTILGMKRREVKSKFDEIVEFSGVEKFIDTTVKHYSSGMKVRLAFSVAAHLEPEILLIDEVLAVGDVDFQKKCVSKMSQVNSSGRTILFVSHDMKMIKRFCPQSILLDSGQLVLSGDTDDVIHHYTQSGMILKNQVKWSNEDQPGDDIVTLISCRIIDSNSKTIDRSSIRESIGIEIFYQIHKVGFEPNPNIHVKNIDNEKLFVSMCEDPVPTNIGKHRVIVWFIQNIFNDDRYIFEVAMTTFQPWKLHLYERDLLSIDFYEEEGERKSGFKGKIPGQIRTSVRYQF